ncbi:MAG TPA: SLC13 family permease, partial [Nitrospiria bacterium]|nr:SLC13 family permease [Nitrospiria bacterium]
KTSPSKLLMPLSFASMFGGVCTLIGSSTNILVSSIAERHGLAPFSMFEFAPLGLVMFAVGFIYMAVAGIRLIPERRKPGDLVQNFGMGDYLTDIVLQPEAKSVGESIAKSPLVLDLDLEVIDLFRNEKPVRPLSGRTVLLAGDVLRVRCNVEKIKALQEREGIILKSDKKIWDKDLKEEGAKLVEAVIAPNSILEGRTLKGARFYHRFGATALAIRHRGEVMRENLETTVLQAGDVLLLEIQKELLEDFKDRQAFVSVSDVGLPEFRRTKILPAVLIVSGVISSAAMGLVPIVVSVIAGCLLLVLMRCITLEEAYRAIEWKVIFLLAGVLTLGMALEKTGASALLSAGLVNTVGAWGPVALMSGFYLLASLLTETMSNSATAGLLAPIAIATAETMGVDSRPFLMAVTFAASASFMTPVGYQTNTI